MPKSKLHALLTTCLCLASAQFAQAGGLILYEMGTPDVGTAAAGRAALAEDASTAFGNPAGMTRLEGSQGLVGVQPFYVDLQFDPGPATRGAGSDGGNAGGFFPALGAYYVHDASPDLKVGFSLASYFGLGLEFDDDWVGRYYLKEAALVTLGATPTLAYRVSDSVSVGAGPVFVYGLLKEKVAINNVLDGLPDGELEVEDDDFGIGGMAGILVTPHERTRVGLQYISEVDLNFKDVGELRGLGPTLQAGLTATGLLGSELDVGLNMPQMVMLSLHQQVTGKLAMLLNAGWQNWENFGKVDVTVSSADTRSLTTESNYDDTWHGAIGFHYDWEDDWRLMSGFAYDSSPVDDEDRTIAFAVDRQLRYAVGVQHQLSEQSSVSVGYTLLDGGDAEIDQSRGPLSGRLQGEFDSNFIHFLNVSYSKAL